MKRFVISILAENSFGVLSRVTGLFARRGYSIDTLTAGTTQIPGISRMTVVARGERDVIEQLKKQLSKLVDVVELYELPEEGSVFRELVLLKVEVDDDSRQKVVSIVDLFRAKVIDVAPASLTIEVTGDQSKINGLLAMMKGFNIIEMARTGLTGLSRGISDGNINNQ
ncbi:MULTISPECIES: acetolactate synthase small subunit [Beduini]|uniref:acetolactate synthase small subunit n=2 Tax=Erysipelotrichaceae TaxID=128827 RepID=UPI00059A9B20|nr:acetolactate synthase small subunit [Beduini massiliensis]